MREKIEIRPQTYNLGYMIECGLSRDCYFKVIVFTTTDVMLFRGGNVVLKEKEETESSLAMRRRNLAS